MRIRMMVHDNLVLEDTPDSCGDIARITIRVKTADTTIRLRRTSRIRASRASHADRTSILLPLESAMEVEKLLKDQKKLLFLEQEIAAMINNYNPKKSGDCAQTT